MTLSVRYNYSAKSKTLYCPLTLFSVLNVQLIWKYSHYHLPQLNHFFAISNFDLYGVYPHVYLNYFYLHFFLSHMAVYIGISTPSNITPLSPLPPLKTEIQLSPLFLKIW